MNSRAKRTLVSAVAGVLAGGYAISALAAPIATMSIVGKKAGGTLGSTVDGLAVGDVVQFEVRLDLQLGANATAGTVSSLVDGKDGANSLPTLILKQFAASGLAIDFDAGSTAFGAGWGDATGVNPGVPVARGDGSGDDLNSVRLVRASGNLAGIDPVTVLTGSFKIVAGNTGGTGKLVGDFYTSTGGLRVNGGAAKVVAATWDGTPETPGADPAFVWAPLVLNFGGVTPVQNPVFALDGKDGNTVNLDFGILVGGQQTKLVTVTNVGPVAGTPAYTPAAAILGPGALAPAASGPAAVTIPGAAYGALPAGVITQDSAGTNPADAVDTINTGGVVGNAKALVGFGPALVSDGGGKSYASLSSKVVPAVSDPGAVGSEATIMGASTTPTANIPVSMEWRPELASDTSFAPGFKSPAPELISDVVRIAGTAGGFELVMTYDETQLANEAASAAQGHIELAMLDGNGTWHVVPGSAVDPATNTVRAQVGGGGVYAVVPEPAALSLLGIASLGLIRRRRNA